MFVLMQFQRYSTGSEALCFDMKDLLKQFACLCRLMLSLFFQPHVVCLSCFMCFGLRGKCTATMSWSALPRPGRREHLDVIDG